MVSAVRKRAAAVSLRNSCSSRRIQLRRASPAFCSAHRVADTVRPSGTSTTLCDGEGWRHRTPRRATGLAHERPLDARSVTVVATKKRVTDLRRYDPTRGARGKYLEKARRSFEVTDKTDDGTAARDEVTR